MGMIFQRNHISLQSAIKKIGDYGHFWELMKLLPFTSHKLYAWVPLPLADYIIWPVGLCADDAKQQIPNTDYPTLASCELIYKRKDVWSEMLHQNIGADRSIPKTFKGYIPFRQVSRIRFFVNMLTIFITGEFLICL